MLWTRIYISLLIFLIISCSNSDKKEIIQRHYTYHIFSSPQDREDFIYSFISSANTELWLSIYELSDDKIISLLNKKALLGIKIYLIVDEDNLLYLKGKLSSAINLYYGNEGDGRYSYNVLMRDKKQLVFFSDAFPLYYTQHKDYLSVAISISSSPLYEIMKRELSKAFYGKYGYYKPKDKLEKILKIDGKEIRVLFSPNRDFLDILAIKMKKYGALWVFAEKISSNNTSLEEAFTSSSHNIFIVYPYANFIYSLFNKNLVANICKYYNFPSLVMLSYEAVFLYSGILRDKANTDDDGVLLIIVDGDFAKEMSIAMRQAINRQVVYTYNPLGYVCDGVSDNGGRGVCYPSSADKSGSVVINEFLWGSTYDKDGKYYAYDQFIELYNKEEYAINLSGWKIEVKSSDGGSRVIAIIPNGTIIEGRGYLTIGESREWAFPKLDITDDDWDNKYDFGIRGSDSVIVLYDKDGREVDRAGKEGCRFDDEDCYPFVRSAYNLSDKIKRSYERIDVKVRGDELSNWKMNTSLEDGVIGISAGYLGHTYGSVGGKNSDIGVGIGCDGGIKVSEYLGGVCDEDGDCDIGRGYIEIENDGDCEVDLGMWYIEGVYSDGGRMYLPNKKISVGGRLILSNDDRIGGIVDSRMKLVGGEIVVYRSDGSKVDEVDISSEDISRGIGDGYIRSLERVGSKWMLNVSGVCGIDDRGYMPSEYYSNTYGSPYKDGVHLDLIPRVGEVVISEIAWMGTLISSYDEWMKLRNESDRCLVLDGVRLYSGDGKIDVVLPLIEVGANEEVLLERADDDTIPCKKADYIYSGSLSDSGVKLVLENILGEELDIVDASGGWFAGDNDSKATMRRVGDSLWETSTSSYYCGDVILGYGSPF
jgi:hypothetical protein